jgi:hypothetical protein
VDGEEGEVGEVGCRENGGEVPEGVFLESEEGVCCVEEGGGFGVAGTWG